MKSLEYTTPSITQIIIQIGPMSLALMGVLYFKEKLGKRQLTGFALAGIGFFLFYRDQLAQHLELADLNLGVIWVLFAAFTWVIYATAQKTISDKYNAQELNLIIYGVAAIMFVFFADFSIVPTLPSDEWPLMIFLAMNTIIAYGCLGAAFNKVEANKISIIITLNPLITIIGMNFLAYLGVKWIAPEKITWQGYLGASLVITGALFVTVFRKKSLEKTPPLAHHQAHDENNEVQA
jgi:drug/metabolite transporter (DMT)-like permease